MRTLDPARLLDVVAVLGPGGHPAVALLNAKHNALLDFADERWPPLRLGAAARHLGIAAEVFDVAWSAPAADFGNDLVVVALADVPRLVGELRPRRLDLLDLPAGPVDADAIALAVNGLRADEPVLAELPGSTWFAGLYDARVVYAEARDPALLARLGR